MARLSLLPPMIVLLAGCKPGPVGPAGVPCQGCVDGTSIAPASVTDAHVGAAGITTRSKLPAALCYQDEANAFSQSQVMQANLSVGGALAVGTTEAPAAALDVRGEVRSEGLYQVGTAALTPYAITTRRYVIEAGPLTAGQVVPIDYGIMSALCRDLDGCTVTVVMLNYDGTNSLASRTSRLFLSQAGNRWQFANDVLGVDGDNVVQEWANWDCLFTDAETRTTNSNGRSDAGPGFGLLNVLGGSYSDATTICRVIIED
jgi:hypothetical protein